MDYKIYMDKLEVRSTIENKVPSYNVSGYALVPNSIHTYKIEDNGKTKRSFKSMFTDNAIKSVQRQAKTKNLFMDNIHEMAASMEIERLLKEKGASPQELENMKSWFKTAQFPLAKIDELDFRDEGLFIDTSLNPHFRELSEDHKNYFDATWKSLQDGYIGGISANFKPKKVIKQIINGEEVDVIDDIDLYGFSYMGGQAIPECNILEVCTRSIREVKKMDEQVETDKAKITEKVVETIKEVVPEDYHKIKLENEKFKQEKVEIEKQKTILNEKEQLDKIKSDILQESEKLEKLKQEGQVSRSKQSVSDPRNYQEKDGKWYHEQVEKISKEPFGFGRVLALQREFNTIETLPDATKRYLSKDSDIVVKKK